MDDEVVSRAAALNSDPRSFRVDRAALETGFALQGADFQQAISVGHEHMFSDVPLFVTEAQVDRMRAVIAAVERVVKLPGWCDSSEGKQPQARGVFYGYDFHLNTEGAHLIEINTNAGGGFLNALLIESQREADFPGSVIGKEDLEQCFIEMFRNEYRLARGDAPLMTVAIVDEQPESQYLYPEFLLAKKMLGRAGIAAYIADPSALQLRDDGLFLDGNRIDLVYNRLTDFSLEQHGHLKKASQDGSAVVTPDATHYACYADKRNLARLSNPDGLRALGADEADIAVLVAGVPNTLAVLPEMEAELWAKRKQLFFKPNTGYGSKGAYRGEKLTKRVFGEILLSDYVAQQMAAPGERMVCDADGNEQPLKYDVRCYVYDGVVQLVAARLYQGQTTNFRTPGGGFSVVRVVE